MSWSRAHARAQVLEAVLSDADRRRDGSLPSLDQPAQSLAFSSPDELLLALLQCWQRRLLTGLDAALEREDGVACDDCGRSVPRETALPG